MKVSHSYTTRTRPSSQGLQGFDVRYDPSSFGSAIGASLQNLGVSVERYQERQQKTQRFGALSDLTKFETSIKQNLAELKRDSAVDVANFPQQAEALYDNKRAQFLNKLPPEFQEEFLFRTDQIKQGVVADALDFQFKSQDAYYNTEANNFLDEARLSLSQSQEPVKDLGAWQGRMAEYINATDLPEAEKARYAREANIALQAVAYKQELVKSKIDRASFTPTGSAHGMAASILMDEEGFRSDPYWDVNALRTGYGSDTVTRADGTVERVTKDTVVTAQDAERDLARRIKEFEQTAINEVGLDVWAQLPANVRAPLISVTYNYGNLPNSVVSAIHTGDMEAVASSVENLSANKERRAREAAIIRGDAMPPERKLDGDPRFGAIPFDLRLKLQNEADTEFDKWAAQDKAQLAVDESNAMAAFSIGQGYEGNPVTPHRYMRAYGAVAGQAKWDEFLAAQQRGDFISSMNTMSEGDIRQNLTELKPTNTAAPDFATRLSSWESATSAANTVIEQRNSDPAGYVMRNYPAVQQAWTDVMEGSGSRRDAYASMASAYDQLGIPTHLRQPLPERVVASETARLQSMSPEDKIAYLTSLQSDMGDMFYEGLEQLEESGMPLEAYLAGLTTASPKHTQVAANVLRGKQMIAENASLKPNAAQAATAFRDYMGSAQLSLPPRTAQSVLDAATALYIFEGGDPQRIDVDTDAFKSTVRRVLGGLNDKDTGLVDYSNGQVTDKTILPPTITEDEFDNWLNSLTTDTLSKLGPMPQYITGEPATPQDIIDEGVFVRVGAQSYIVKMGSDGFPLQDGAGNPYIVELTPEIVRRSGPLVPSSFEGGPAEIYQSLED